MAAGVGWSAGSGTRGNTDNPINAMSGPLLGSVPPKVSNSPTTLAGDPVKQRQGDPHTDVDPGSPRDERSEADDHGDRGKKRSHPDPRTGEGMTGRIEEVGVPAGLAVRRFRQLVRDGVGRPVEGEHPDDRLEEPEAGPHEQRTRPAQDAAAGRGRCSAHALVVSALVRPGPHQQTEKHVEADCTGSPLQRRRLPGQHHAEPLAEEVEARAPYERGHERRLHGPPEEQSDSDGDLNDAEEGNPERRPVGEQVGRVVDGRVDQARLAGGHRPDDFRDERGLEEVRLELQQPVDDPDRTEQRTAVCAGSRAATQQKSGAPSPARAILAVRFGQPS